MFTGKVYLCEVMLSSTLLLNYFRLRNFTPINERHRFQVAVIVVSSSSCNKDEIDKCVKTFTDSVGTNLGDTDAEIKKQCNNYPSLKTCLSQYVTDECPLEARIGFEGFTSLYDYVCDEGFEDALEYNECLREEDNEACKNTWTPKFEQATDDDMITKCGYFKDYINCLRTATLKNCGTDAADFMDKITHLASEPFLEKVGCGCGSIAAVMWVVVGAVSVR